MCRWHSAIHKYIDIYIFESVLLCDVLYVEHILYTLAVTSARARCQPVIGATRESTKDKH